MTLQPFDAHRLLIIANLSMAIGLALLLFGVAGAYFFDQHLALGMVVACHALVILGPTALKIGYVMRLLAQRQLILAA
ncbi:hypothetical protein [Pseudomonas sp. SST3]|uniref:hypothetical protein n=1 Tax=Pseudomonas sp. SST3 TaxID=2267882 RepID=UPI000DF875ED|nr:hypothetical protein [Pseudomonas sp. SST3]NKQ09950.1 hypothetical protein [Pseudomonas sp. SST3]